MLFSVLSFWFLVDVGVSGMGFEAKIERLLNPNPYVMRERAGEADYNTVGSPYVFDEFKKGILYKRYFKEYNMADNIEPTVPAVTTMNTSIVMSIILHCDQRSCSP